MNTKQKRVVVTLFLALATLATMGFSTTHESAVALTADVATCELTSSYAAIELLELVDQPCAADLLNEVETEIDKGFASVASTEALLGSIRERIRPTGSVEYLALLEGEEDVVFASRSARPTTGSIFVDEWLRNYIELDGGAVNPSVSPSTSAGTDIEWFANLIELTEPGTDPEEFIPARSGSGTEWFANLIELVEPGTDPE